MPASPTDDRSARERANEQQRRHEAGGRVPDPAAQKDASPTQPRQPARERYFAPGEDGECH